MIARLGGWNMARMRNPRKEEIGEVFDLLDRVFQYERIGYSPERVREFFESIDESDVLVMEEDGKIVSQVFMKPYRMHVCGAVLLGAEVGGVATDERYRGRGFASALLEEAVRRMVERGYDISTLGGYRDRYARFGWERGGAMRVYAINGRSVRRAGDCSGVELRRYDPSDLEARRKVIWSYERNQVHAIRPEAEHRLTYDAPTLSGMGTWIAESAGEFAYVVARRSRNGASVSVLEHGGDPQTLVLALGRAFDEWKLDEARITSPDWYTEFTPFLESVSEGWSVHPARQINVLNLENCLRKLLPVTRSLAGEVLEEISRPYSVTLRNFETGQRATLLFDRGCELSDEDGEEELSLGRCG
ncbi:MAG: GNAT family N-acetyltransferase, partial [Candidatus Brockarchaeota archaeon]|nr:GNAT family N-acetyltransferase [Candidatus Brockarchaeota archaeon]